MGNRHFSATAAAVIAMFTGQAAQASTAIYQGECSRAYEVQKSSPINTLMKFSRYKAVSMHRFGEESEKKCDSDKIIMWELTLVESSSLTMKYDVKRKEFYISKNVPTCEKMYGLNENIIGTVKFSTSVTQNNGLCEFYIWTEWSMSETGNSTWTSVFSNRSIVINDGTFVLAQPGPSADKYQTPFAFSGVN